MQPAHALIKRWLKLAFVAVVGLFGALVAGAEVWVAIGRLFTH